ncbi:MAG: archaellin/type IV pilin N-terminal domain-containing protein [Methanolinea sp.]|jgi:flagellin FlaB
MRKHELKDDAFTGLEAAIVLIAFVVVAAVFSYVVLGAGFFTTQKSQETIYSGVSQSTSNIEVVGPVAVNATGSNTVHSIFIKIKTAAGASDMDLSKMTFTVSTAGQTLNFIDRDSTATSGNKVGRTYIGTFSNDDALLKPGEIIEIQFPVSQYGETIGLSTTFSIELKPAVGAPLLLQKTTPAGMTSGGYYELY